MVQWHHRINGHEFEQTLGDSEGQEAYHAADHGPPDLETTQLLTTAYLKNFLNEKKDEKKY